MASTSGSLVPPTCGRSGCSQKRVQATGVTPQASSVSVTDGTRLTTRAGAGAPLTCGRAAAAFLACELGLGEEPLATQLVELADLLGDRVVAVALVGFGMPPRRPMPRSGRTCGSRSPPSAGRSRSAPRDGLPDVGEGLPAHLARRLDHEVARAEHPLEDRLVEEDGVDPLERDLDAVLGEHAVAVDEPVGRDDEVGRRSSGRSGGRTTRGSRGSARRPETGASRCRCRPHTSIPSTTAPMSANIGSARRTTSAGGGRGRCSSLSFSSFRGNGTGAAYPCGVGWACHPRRRPRSAPAQLGQPVVVDAEVVATSWTTVIRTCSTTSSSVEHRAQIGSAEDGDAVRHHQARRSRRRGP